uniref:Uncharacterized protein n=1 Tax=Hyaloperonospora arabidopsidis (strain Emoy2) TaxID=559515 RepID=M4BI79_HYAAE
MSSHDGMASHDHSTWFSSQTVKLTPLCSISHTTEKSIVVRLQTHEEQTASSGDTRTSDNRATHALRLTQDEEYTGGRSDSDVNKTLAALYEDSERKKQWLDSEEKTFRCGQQRLGSLQREYAALLRTLEQRKRRRKERLYVTKMLRGGPRNESRDRDCDCDCESTYSSGCSDSDDSSCKDKRLVRRCSSCSSCSQSCRPRRDGANRERERLRQFRREVSLRFQLLESECRESKLQMEKVVADLRREYADSCLFGTSLKF